jgi:hypothetical protein
MSLNPETGIAARSEAQAFLSCLDPQAKQFTFQTFSDTKSGEARTIHGPYEASAGFLHNLNDLKHGVFVTVQETDLKARKEANIRRIRAIFVDYDRKDGAADISLDAVVARMNFPIEPTMIVGTSAGKYHFYWCISDMWQTDEQGKRLFHGIMARMVQSYHHDKGCKDLPRVMRLPGFVHNKGEAHPVKLIKVNGPKYTVEQIKATFPPILKDDKPKKNTTGKAPKKAASGQFEFDEEIPQTWAQEALRRGINRLRNATSGSRNTELNAIAFQSGQICELGALDEDQVREQLAEAAEEIGLEAAEIEKTIESGFKAAENKPLELSRTWLDWGKKGRTHGQCLMWVCSSTSGALMFGTTSLPTGSRSRV